MKKIHLKLIFVIVFIALFVTACGKTNVPNFSDVPKNGAFYKSIETMVQGGYMVGTSTDPAIFSPDDPLTRAQAAVLVLRLEYGASWTPPAATGSVFADMDVNHWGTAWAEKAYSEGLVYGCGSKDGKPIFCPDEPMVFTRELIAYFIATDLR
jgi:hypothetical protein